MTARRSLRDASKTSRTVGREGVEKAKQQAAEAKARDEELPRTKLTADLPKQLLDEVRVAVQNVPPADIKGGLSGLVEQALEVELQRLRDKWNSGRAFEIEEPEPRLRRKRDGGKGRKGP